MRIAIAEDSGIFRQALTSLLSGVGISVTASAANGEELLVLLRHDQPDVVILDLHMPPTYTDEGVAAAKWIKVRYPRVGVLVLSAYNETPQAVALFDGVTSGMGYLLKDHVSDISTLREALNRIVAGEVVIDPHVVARLVAARQDSDELGVLSSREREVLALMAEGYSNAGLARRLYLSPRTVEDHVRGIFLKLDLGRDGPELGAQNGNRRVLAVLAWLRAARGVSPEPNRF